MNALARYFIATSLAAACAIAPTLSRAERVAKDVPDYTIFLDPPTGFVFVKLPAGWKFVGKVDTKDQAKVPSHVVTALLSGSDDEGDAVARSALQRDRR